MTFGSGSFGEHPFAGDGDAIQSVSLAASLVVTSTLASALQTSGVVSLSADLASTSSLSPLLAISKQLAVSAASQAALSAGLQTAPLVALESALLSQATLVSALGISKPLASMLGGRASLAATAQVITLNSLNADLKASASLFPSLALQKTLAADLGSQAALSANLQNTPGVFLQVSLAAYASIGADLAVTQNTAVSLEARFATIARVSAELLVEPQLQPQIYNWGQPQQPKTAAEREQELVQKYGRSVFTDLIEQEAKAAADVALKKASSNTNIFLGILQKKPHDAKLSIKIPENVSIQQEFLAEMDDEDAAIVCAIAMML